MGPRVAQMIKFYDRIKAQVMFSWPLVDWCGTVLVGRRNRKTTHAWSVRKQMEGDDGEDDAGGERGGGGEEDGEMLAEDGDCAQGGLPQIRFLSPSAQDGCGAGDEHGEGQRDEQGPKAQTRTEREPVDDGLSRVGGFELLGLEVADEQRGHE